MSNNMHWLRATSQMYRVPKIFTYDLFQPTTTWTDMSKDEANAFLTPKEYNSLIYDLWLESNGREG